MGEIFAFLGPNGAGKTTTIKMLTTLLRPTGGKIEIDGLDPAHQQERSSQTLRHRFRDPSLDDELTALGESGPARRAVRSASQNTHRTQPKPAEAVRTLGPAQRSGEAVLRRHAQASGNRSQPVCNTPKIIFLDELTLGLDPQTRNQLWAQVKKLNEEERVTVFLTTHYMEEAERVAGRIAVIDHGAIVAQGTPAELKQQTNTQTLEEAFLALTGSSIREEGADSNQSLRNMAQMWRKKR